MTAPYQGEAWDKESLRRFLPGRAARVAGNQDHARGAAQ